MTLFLSLFSSTVAGLSDNSKLLGTTKESAAQIEQWISWADEEIFNKFINLMRVTSAPATYNKNVEQNCWADFERSFTYLESYLKTKTFLVGHRLTLADLTLASDLQHAFVRVLGSEFRNKYPNTIRYYNTIINQPAVLDIYKGAELAQENVKFKPPVKEQKPKAAPAAAAAAPAPKKEKAAPKKKAAEEDDDEDDTPKAAPPPKHPCASLPPSPFILDEAKRQYSNLDTPDFLKWFYEHFDKEGYSIWRFDFKYNEELTMTFMSSNQISGFFDRLEGSRKYIMGAGCVYGENNNSRIAGTVICRGKDYKPCLEVAPDLESYEVKALDPFNNAADKKFFEENLAWEGTLEDGKAVAQGKFLK